MPTKEKEYHLVIFTPEVIMQAVQLMKEISGKPEESRKFIIHLNSGERWMHDNQDEFFADYRKKFEYCAMGKSFMGKGNIEIQCYKPFGVRTIVSVYLPKREEVERVFAIFEDNADKCRIPIKSAQPKVKVFIGHGHNTQWRDLKEHLQDKHGLEVQAFETGARAGLSISDVLDEMLTNSSFATIVLTGEDKDANFNIHARENVIHELGLFQGRLGWRKTVALVEEGISEFSNIHGLQQIRFSKDHIKESFGELLATIKREFPNGE
jgi:hypothetical protein